MTNLPAHALIAALAVTLAGCHLGYNVEILPRPEMDPRAPHAELAKVCLLRPQTFGALAAFNHYDNGRLVGVTQGSKIYFCYLAHPGLHHVIARSDNDARLELTLRAGQVQYVQLKVSIGPDSISPVLPQQALLMLPDLRYVRAEPTISDVPAPCRLPVPAARPRSMPASAMPAPAGEVCPAVITPL